MTRDEFNYHRRYDAENYYKGYDYESYECEKEIWQEYNYSDENVKEFRKMINEFRIRQGGYP
jgi:hypothetical protein